MKKSVLFLGLSVLMSSATFVSCSKNDAFEQNKASMEASEKDEYRSYFEAKYGKIDPNQSWDFTNFSNGANTRATNGVITGSVSDPSFFQQSVHNDKAELKQLIESNSIAVSTFNPNVMVSMYPTWCHDESKKNNYYTLAVNYNDVVTDLSTVKIKNGAWWNNNGADCPSQKGISVNTMSLQGATWVVKFLNNKRNELGRISISTFKEVTVSSGRTYWCFDCDGDGKYYDLIYLVLPNPAPVAKRYLIEDLGSKDDFDFNDIVVDVKQNDDGSEMAIIRAMGGTLDFTLKIGKTTWTKSVQGAALGYDVETMYNTQSPDVTKILAEFPVSGWVASQNNISVEVESKANQNVIIQIPFPRKGEAPMIIALNTYVDWQTERAPLPQNWWSPLPDSEE